MEVINLKNMKLGTTEKLQKINLQSFNQSYKKQNVETKTTKFKELMPSVNYFGAGRSEEDKAFKDFFTKY